MVEEKARSWLWVFVGDFLVVAERDVLEKHSTCECVTGKNSSDSILDPLCCLC